MTGRMQACDGTEKVKRRMIRTIGRLLQEKKPQDEIWEYMEKEYGKKCKVLWDRMRILTLKKLKCLFNAVDVVNNVPKMARMTLTDWLIFDLVLVHEKFDVIDMKSIRDNKPNKVLYNLFSLVLRFEIEGRIGEELANAWISATVHYNSLGHQCSPMLLQRRWYQLKELTRSTFYKFWFIFRGNKRQLDQAMESSPICELQRDIALRYSNIITKPFVEWCECIEKRTVIMPDEFDSKMRTVTLMKPSDLSVPDLVLIEPKISMIDLCDDSDVEVDEDKNKEEDTDQDKAIESSPVIIKSEPIDLEEDDAQDAQTLPTQDDENNDFEEEIQRLQLVENEIIINSDDEAPMEDREGETNTPDGNDERAQSVDGSEVGRKSTDEKAAQVTTENTILDTLINAAAESEKNIDAENTSDVNQDLSSEVIVIDENLNTNESDGKDANLIIKSENIEDTFSENYIENADSNNESVDLPDLVVKVENDALINEANPEATFPVISTVSSAGVLVNMDTAIQGVSNNVTPMDNDDIIKIEPEDVEINQNVEDDFRENYVIGQSDNSNIIDNLRHSEDKDDSSSEEDIIKIPAPVVNKDESQFNDVISHDLEFADDGIQLVDDGIEYIESDEDNNTKTEDEQPQIDQKLLMVPVVYTTKLDNMNVFKQRLLIDGAKQMHILEKIIAESKPISRLAFRVKPEKVIKSKMEEPKQYEQNISKQPLIDVNVINEPLIAFSNDGLKVKDEQQDLEENTALDSESDEEFVVPRIKTTSYLLRKPRRRSYNPIQLCKNPDFNTRLKRLPVSFFMSQRNRHLLNDCKPMTIDVCKAFENKLLNGTLYLTNTGQCHFTSPVKVNKADTVPTASVITPSATPVQSLMDIDKLLVDELKKRMGERNKTINLPDITEVRRINQHLLTAEVTPLRISPSVSPVNEDASIVIEENQDVSRQDIIEKVANEEVVLPEIPPLPTIATSKPTNTPSESTTKSSYPEASTNSDQNHMSLNKIRKQHRRTIHPPLNWRSTKVRPPADNSDLLLTTDTLYKMLFAIDPNAVKSSSYNKYVSACLKNKVVMQKKTIYTPKGLSHKKVEDEPIEIVDDSNEKPKNNDKQENHDKQENNQEKSDDQTNQTSPAKARIKVVYDKTKFVKRKRYCCWANARINLLNGNTTRCRPHKCREICSCCCKLELADMIFTNESPIGDDIKSATKTATVTNKEIPENEDEKIKNACESIESVVQQTRNIPQVKPLYVPAAAKVNTVDISPAAIDASTHVDLTTNDDTHTTRVSDAKKRNLVKLAPREPSLLEKLAEAQSQAKLQKRPPIIPRSYKKISGPDKSKWTLCPCKRPVLKLSGQRTIVVDGTSTCPFHTNDRTRQGHLYINRKGNERPIFIGKNKLLLSNVQKPGGTLVAPSQDSATFPSVPLVENLQLPEGVQIILLPNGSLTYTVDNGANVSAEQLSVMPTILTAIQSQISYGNLAVIDPSAGEQKEKIKESSEIIGFKEGSASTVPVQPVPSSDVETTPSTPIDIINQDNETVSSIAGDMAKNDDQTKLIETNNTDITHESPNKEIEASESAEISQKTNELTTEIEKENDDEEIKLIIDENVNKAESTKQELDAIPTENTKNCETNETDTTTQKNRASLLSDLMEMSGICDEDMAPAAVPVTQNVTLSDVQERSGSPLVTQCTQPRLIPVPPLSPLSPSPKKTDLNDIYANLCTVNSFAELKYSYNNNGLFFKLDLESGVIVPITLCIKKKQPPVAANPSSVIDLTDEMDNEDENVTFKTTEKNAAASDVLNPSVFKRVLKQVKTAGKSLNLKKIKPNILQRGHQLTTKQRSLLKISRRPRKIYPDKVEAQIDLVDSDNPMEEEFLQSSDDVDTSDDEPLAKKAKRVAEERNNATPVDFEEQIDSANIRKLDLTQAMEIDDKVSESLQEAETKTVHDDFEIPSELITDAPEDSPSPQETETENSREDFEIPSELITDTPENCPSNVTMDDPKPTHLVLTRDDHHETVPIDSFYNDDGDDEDSQDCILGV